MDFRLLVENAVGNCKLVDFPLVMATPSLFGPSCNLAPLKHRYRIPRDVKKARQLLETFGRRLMEVIEKSRRTVSQVR
jgi:hypothetical protein